MTGPMRSLLETLTTALTIGLATIVPTWMFLSSGAASSAAIAACYLLLLGGVALGRPFGVSRMLLLPALALFLAALAIASATSLQPSKSLAAVGNSLLCVAPLLLLALLRAPGPWLPAPPPPWLALGLGLAFAFLAIEAGTQLALTRVVFPTVEAEPIATYSSFARGWAFLAALVWPVGLLLCRTQGPLAAAGLLLLAAIAIFSGYPDSVKAAFLLAGAAFLLGVLLPRLLRLVLYALLPLGILAAPLLPALLFPHRAEIRAWFKDSVLHRVEYWHFLMDKWDQRPILGWGPQMASRLGFDAQDGSLYWVMSDAPPYPHNILIEVWCELGLLGALGLCAVAVAVLSRLRRLPDADLPWAAATLCTILSIGLISFSLWSDFMAVLLILPAIVFRWGRTAPTA